MTTDECPGTLLRRLIEGLEAAANGPATKPTPEATEPRPARCATCGATSYRLQSNPYGLFALTCVNFHRVEPDGFTRLRVEVSVIDETGVGSTPAPEPIGFTVARSVSTPWTCDRCGAFVDDNVVHAEWHRRVG